MDSSQDKDPLNKILEGLKSTDPEIRRQALQDLRDMKGERPIEALNPLLEILKTENYERIGWKVSHILREIAEKSSVETIPILLKALDEGTKNVKIGILRALETITWKNPSLVPQSVLFKQLKDENERVRLYALFALHGPLEIPITDFIEALNDESMEVRRAIVDLLCRINKEKITNIHLTQLIKILENKQEHGEVRGNLVRLFLELGKKNPQSMMPILMRVLKDEELLNHVYHGDPSGLSSVGQEITWGLEKIGKIHPEKTIPHLIKALKIPEYGDKIAFKAIIEIAKAKQNEAIPILLEHLKDQDEKIRSKIAEALGKIGSSKAVKPLIQVLKDKDSDIRGEAIWALGQIGDSRAFEPLIEALMDENSYIRRSAANALEKIRHPRSVKFLIKALKDENSGVRRNAARALGKIGDNIAVESLIKVLKDEDINFRLMAIEALGEIGNKKAVKPLIETLKDKDKSIRKKSAWALGKIRDLRAIESLTRALKDEFQDVRKEAVKSLGEIKDPQTIEPLNKALQNEYWDVQERAAWALGEIGDKRAEESLTKALKDKVPDVRKAAKEALEKIKEK